MEFFLDTFWREKVRFFRQVSFCECAGSNYSFRDKLRGSSVLLKVQLKFKILRENLSQGKLEKNKNKQPKIN
ncbi:unnamed protein product [Oikopleura dioica]|uniref:Uncharacterized protein n=1 Tax=Oikopleura dioica TaxID=34765 RepID=E4XJK6_OIKDI|nr:unnamed protein product [Oikopleura dioica]